MLIPLDLQFFGNKVKFGLKNVHFATFSKDPTTGAITYDTPIPIPGAVEISLEPRGDMVEFYADDMLYYSAPNNQGYDGTLSIANLPEQFEIDALGEEKDETDMVLTEKTTAKGKPFAFLFEFDGDVKATRHVLYNCTANRPTVSSATKTNSVEPTPTELTFVSSPRDTDYVVKRKTTVTTPAAVYDSWYSTVFEKTAPAV
ncbi:major tail protein [Ornithinibacillus sp. 16A2E]|uniref:Major tail protein n=2 Tax=Ornithinibacillus xuwenensis TaxID=3144668 RepID=A0ABU9XBQ3_9BACI